MEQKKLIIFFISLLLVSILIFLVILFPTKTPKKVSEISIETTELGLSFPPVQNIEQVGFTVEHMKKLNVSLLRFGVNWKIREPEESEYNWKPLDDKINLLYENDMSVLLTIKSDGPDWACEKRNQESCVFKDNEKFRLFVRELMKRYSGKIDKIQFGNEWDNEWGFVGNEKDFVRYTNIVYEETKEYSPKTQVVLGGVTRSVPLYLLVCESDSSSLRYPLYYNAGEKQVSEQEAKEICAYSEERVVYVLENAKYDLADLHIYDEVENWDEYYNAFKNSVNVPVIVTEFGIQEGFSAAYSMEISHAEQIAKALKKLDNLEVPEAYYFNLVDGSTGPHKKSGLIDSSLKEKPGYFVFKERSY